MAYECEFLVYLYCIRISDNVLTYDNIELKGLWTLRPLQLRPLLDTSAPPVKTLRPLLNTSAPTTSGSF